MAVQLAEQPQPGQAPVALHRLGRDVEDVRGLLEAQPAEETQFDDAALSRVDGGKGLQRPIEIDNVDGRAGGGQLRRIDAHPFDAAAALVPGMRARVIDEHPPHEARSKPDEVRAARRGGAASRRLVSMTQPLAALWSLPGFVRRFRRYYPKPRALAHSAATAIMSPLATAGGILFERGIRREQRMKQLIQAVATTIGVFGLAGAAFAGGDADRCSTESLHGEYVLSASGFTVNPVTGAAQPKAIVEVIDFDGDRTLAVPAATRSVNGAIARSLPGSGSY